MPFHHHLIYLCPEGATQTIVMDQQMTNPMASSSILSSAGAPSFSAGGSFDTLDFSLPSYDQATKGDTLDSVREPAKAETSSDASAEKAAKKEQEAQERAERKVCVGSIFNLWAHRSRCLLVNGYALHLFICSLQPNIYWLWSLHQ